MKRRHFNASADRFNPKRKALTLLLGTWLITTAAGCDQRPTPQMETVEGRREVVYQPVPHDAFVTWYGYKEADFQSATYVFNGVEIGKGDAGVERLVREIGDLPKG